MACGVSSGRHGLGLVKIGPRQVVAMLDTGPEG